MFITFSGSNPPYLQKQLHTDNEVNKYIFLMVKNTSPPNYIRTKVESNSYLKNVKRHISVQYKCSELNCCHTPLPISTNSSPYSALSCNLTFTFFIINFVIKTCLKYITQVLLVEKEVKLIQLKMKQNTVM